MKEQHITYPHSSDQLKRDKINVQFLIFEESKNEPFTWKDIKHLDLQDDDEITFEHDPGYYSENESWDPCFRGFVTRTRLENNSEYSKRVKRLDDDAIRRKNQRRENYLKLKKEFENEETE